MFGLILRILWQIVKTRKPPFKILFVDKIIALLFLLGISTMIFFLIPLKSAFWGFRFDFEMFLIYFLARSYVWKKPEIQKSVLIILSSAMIVALFALLQAWFLPADFLTHFGYSSGVNWQQAIALPAYQTIGASNVVRMQSFLAGPNQLGSYLLIPIFISLVYLISAKSNKLKLLLTVYCLLLIFSLFYTYSRSAWLAFAAGLVVLILIKIKQRYPLKTFLITMSAIFVVLIGLLIFIQYQPFGIKFADVYINHQGSNLERFSRLQASFETIIKTPWGLGIGQAGQAQLHSMSATALISENWYLQIGVELGILGLIIYLLVIYHFLKNLWQTLKFLTGKFGHDLSLAVFSGFIVLSLHAMFLHTWSDISTALTFWFLVGLILTQTSTKLQKST